MSDDGLEQVNRFLIVVAAIFAAFVALIVVVVAWGASSESIGRLEDFTGFLRHHNHNEEKLVVTLGAVVVVLLALLVIIIEATPPSTQKMRVRNMKSGGGAVITTTDIAKRINGEVSQVPHVASCSASVAGRNKKVEVALDLYVDQSANLADTADAACRRAQALVEGQLGIGLARPPSARLHYRELRLRDETAAAVPAKRDAVDNRWAQPADRSQSAVEEERDERGRADAAEQTQA